MLTATRNIWFPQPAKLLRTENTKMPAYNRIYEKSEKYVKDFNLPMHVYNTEYYTYMYFKQPFNFSHEYNHSHNQSFPYYENNLAYLSPL